ncbi:MAG: AMP-binding protein, partial [Novosphingobium sp.]|nr:AMP-binding protein [Novosphingobium sp.]
MISRLLEKHCNERPDTVAIDPVIASPVTYSRLADLVTEKARHWQGTLSPGRPVALQMDHGQDEAVAELAALMAQIPVLSLPRFFTEEQIQHAIRVCGAQMPTIAGHVPVSSAPVPLLSGTARITFTSGSTGTPKGVCLSADHMFAVARAIVDTVGMQHAGRHLALLPPGILLETVGGFFASLLAGGTWVCPPQAAIGLANPFQPDFAAMLAAMADQRITSLILVPEYLGGLVQAMEATGQRLPLLTLVAVGGARVPPELMIRARALGLPVRQGYGMTECASVVSLEDAGDDMPGNAGRPLPHMRARIAPDGEILLEGPLCLGTIGGKAPATPFATGDTGRIDEHGRLWIEGRKSSLIVTSYGRNIAPEWVEAALLAQPEIAQAMVYGDGEPAPMALLVPAQPDSDLAAAVARANATLPGYAHVRDWREAAHFAPANGRLTGNGRLRRKAIAEAYLDGPPAYFDQLEADTVRQRLQFLAIPQLQAGLNGTITRQAYLDYLAQAYHHVRHTVPLMRAAHARLADRPDLLAALDEYIEEEEGHEEWILNDITAAGGNGEHVRTSDPAPATAAMVAHAYDRIEQDNPVCFFGMVYVLESVSIALAQRGA